MIREAPPLQPNAKELFAAASALPPHERTAFLRSRCGDDRTLLEEVESLLAFHDADGPFLDRPAIEEFVASPIAPAAGATISPGQRIGRFTVVDAIGEGGMGVVYAARQDSPDRLVALKVLRPGTVRPTMLRRFRQEAAALARLQHPGIAQIYEAGLADDDGDLGVPRPYIAMELVRGTPLTAYADARELPLADRIALLAQVCDAVHHAHQRGVIHRDLKPANILVDDEGRPKVLDFGIARVMHDGTGAGAATLEQTHALRVVGTLPYMSPEQAGGGAVTAASDVYALGVILYELVVGRPPLDLADMALPAAVRLITQQEPVRLGAIDRRWRGDLEIIAEAALRKEPGRRYASAAELAADLRRFLRHEPITARPPTLVYQLGKLARRHRAMAGAAAGIAVSLVIGSAATSLALVHAMRAERASAEHLVEARAAAARVGELAAFLRKTLSHAEPGATRGRDTTLLREMLDAAAAESWTAAPDHPEARAEIQLTLGQTYLAIGEYDAAAALIGAALAIRTEIHGEHHLETARAVQALAGVHLDRADFPEATALLRRAVEIRTALLGPEHPDTLDSAAMLARTMLEWPDDDTWAEAFNLAQRTLDIQRRVLGNNDPAVAASLISIAVAHRQAGRSAEAEAALREALEIREAQFGDDSPEIAGILVNLALAREQAGDLAEADRLLSRGIDIRRRMLEPAHSALAFPLVRLAGVRIAQGRPADGETLAREAAEVLSQRLGPDHPQTGEAMAAVADTLAAQGRWREAAEQYAAGADRIARRDGENHWRAVELRRLAAEATSRVGR